MRPLIIYVDTEFTGVKPNMNDAQLISIGLIDETGTRTFYAELIEDYTAALCCQFVIDEILPLLDASELSGELAYSAIYARMTADQIREHLTVWLKQFDGPLELRSNFPEFCWQFVHRIFNGHQWPENLLPEVNHCLPMGNPMQLLNFYKRAEAIFDKQQFMRNHALDEVKVMRLAVLGETA